MLDKYLFRSILNLCFVSVHRFARFYKDENGNETRTLFKAYGIKFILTLQGKAGKFSVVPLLLNIGSGLAILSIVSKSFFIYLVLGTYPFSMLYIYSFLS